MAERLDEERLEVLRAWGAGLSTSGRDELRAAGKAIVMLIEEIDRLQADVWNARAAATPARPVSEPEIEAPAIPTPAPEPSRPRIRVDSPDALAMTLSERIARGRAPTEPAG